MSSNNNFERLEGGELLDNVSYNGDKSKIIEEQNDDYSTESRFIKAREIIGYKSLKIKKLGVEIEGLKDDRKLKNITLIFIITIVSINILVSVSLIIANAVFIGKFNKTLYSEKFLGFLLGSQLIIMPFVLLKIITKHLFPNKDK